MAIVNKVVPDDQLLAEATDWAEQLATFTFDQSPKLTSPLLVPEPGVLDLFWKTAEHL